MGAAYVTAAIASPFLCGRPSLAEGAGPNEHLFGFPPAKHEQVFDVKESIEHMFVFFSERW